MKNVTIITILVSLMTVSSSLFASNFIPTNATKISDAKIEKVEADQKMKKITKAQVFGLDLYRAAVDIYYPGLKLNDPEDMKYFFSALARSGLVYMDTFYNEKNDKWAKGAGKCLGGLNQNKLSKCHEMLEVVRNMYSSSTPNEEMEIGKPTLEHALALVIVEEDLFKILHNLSDEMISDKETMGGAPGGMGKMGSPNMCLMVQTPKGNGGNANGCTMGGFAGGFGDPSPIGGGAYSSMGPSGHQIDPAKVFEKNNCPGVDTSKFGGNISNGGENGDGNSDSVGGENNDSTPGGETGNNSDNSSNSDPTNNNDTMNNSDNNSKSNSGDTSNLNSVVEKYKDGATFNGGKVTVGKGDFSSPKPAADSILENHQGTNPPGAPNGGYGIGITVTFGINPLDDHPIGSQCLGGNLNGGLQACYPGNGAANTDIAPIDPPEPDVNTGGEGPAMMDPELCSPFGYAGDPSPIDDGDDGSGGSACGPSVGGKPSAACCEENPSYPGCGGGGNPTYMDSLISNPGELHTTPQEFHDMQQLTNREKTPPRN